MKKIAVFLALGLLSVISLPTGQAEAHGVGMDIIRLVDKNQDDGMFNIHGQIGVAGDAAVALGFSSGDDLTIVDGGLKYYFGRYLNSLFLQFGVGYYDHDIHGDDFGFVCALGYERGLTDFLAVSGSVKMVAGVDEEIIGYGETPVFQPTLSILITF